ncbi:MAG: LOG family protein [Gemmatimonadetes bacterium]|nr:LOG family protein [Gemmatimonadota bacterium]
MSSPLVAVFGSGADRPKDVERARALGAALGRAGYGVINGGYGGTMSASAAGARLGGGPTVGVTCAEFGRAGPNPHLDEVIEAGILTERLGHLIRRAAAYVVLPGGNGTLTELSLAWEHLRKRLVEPRPLVVWEDPWRPIIEAIAAGPYLSGGTEHITWVDDVDAAVTSIRARVPTTR